MAQVVEILLIGWIVVMTVRVATGRIVLTALGLGTRIIAFGIAAGVGWIVFELTDFYIRNPVGRAVIAIVIAVIVAVGTVLGIAWLLRRSDEDDDGLERKSLKRKVDDTFKLPGWLNRTASLIAACLYVTVMIFAFVFIGRLFSFSEAHAPIIENTLLWSRMISNDGNQDVDVNIESRDTRDVSAQTMARLAERSDPLTRDEARAMQETLFGGLKRSVDQSREWLLETTGTDVFVEQFNALQEIAKLPVEQREWIVQNHPDILALVDNPNVLRALDNDRIIQLVEKAAGGSVIAVYELGDEPDVQALFDDPQIRRLISEIDLIDIRDQVREHFSANADQ